MEQARLEKFVADAVAEADLGDARLVERLETVLRAAASGPDRSFPKMCSNDAELEGTYRFLSNEKVTPQGILEPHFRATAARVKACPRVVVAHDSTELAFGPVPRGDLELVGRGTTYGFNAHVSLAVSGDELRTPLGVLALTSYNRHFGAKRLSPEKRKVHPDNPMHRWGKHVELVRERTGPLAAVIHVMDREADDFCLLEDLSVNGTRFVIRQAVNRRLSKEVADPKVRSLLEQKPILAERTVDIAARRKPTKKKHATRQPLRDARTIRLEMRAAAVSIPKTRSAGPTAAASLKLHLVHVIEAEPPEGQAPIEWWLWTNEAIDSEEDVLAIVDAYRARWAIEELFKALKTGCCIEERQLESKHALQNALAIFIPVAWRLLLLRSVSRLAPLAPAELALTALQQRALRGHFKLKRNIELPEKLTAREAMLAVAAMGGHIKNNGDPGWIVLGRGFDHLLSVEEGLAIALNL